MERKSFEEGIILALVSPPLPHVVKKQPISYSYNGVILPALPEWDREMYPYAVIYKNDINGKEQYVFSAYEYHNYIETSGGAVFYGTGLDGKPAGFAYVVGANMVNASPPQLDDWTMNNSDRWSFRVDKPYQSDVIWTNFDLNYSDGTLFCAASDPIPVYE